MTLCKDCLNCVVKENATRCLAGRWFNSNGEEKVISYVNKSKFYFGCKNRFGRNNPIGIKNCTNFDGMDEAEDAQDT